MDCHDGAKYPQIDWTQTAETLDVLRELAPLLSQSHIGGAEVLSERMGDDAALLLRNHIRLLWTDTQHRIKKLLATPQVVNIMQQIQPLALKCDAVVMRVARRRPNEQRLVVYLRLGGVVLLLWMAFSRGLAAYRPRVDLVNSSNSLSIASCPSTAAAWTDSHSRGRRLNYHLVLLQQGRHTQRQEEYRVMDVDNSRINSRDGGNAGMPELCRDADGALHVFSYYHHTIPPKDSIKSTQSRKAVNNKKDSPGKQTHPSRSTSKSTATASEPLKQESGDDWLMFVDKIIVLVGLSAMSLLAKIPTYASPCLMGALLYVLVRIGGLL
jgi:hypothetical protein